MRRKSKFRFHVVVLVGCGVAFLLTLIYLQRKHNKTPEDSSAFIYYPHNVYNIVNYIAKNIKTKHNENTNLTMTSNSNNKSRSRSNITKFGDTLKSSIISDQFVLKPRHSNTVTTRYIDGKSRILSNVLNLVEQTSITTTHSLISDISLDTDDIVKPHDFISPNQDSNFNGDKVINSIPKKNLKHTKSSSMLKKPSVPLNNNGSLRTMFDNSDFSRLLNKSNASTAQVCVHPQLDINEPHLAKFFFSVPPIICNAEPDWLTIENGIAYITPIYRKTYGNFYCVIRCILRNDDFSVTLTQPMIIKSSSRLYLKHDFFTCRCQVKISSDKFKVYENVHAGISVKPVVNLRPKNTSSGLGLNVLMLGFDSISHMTFMRKLQKTYRYFTDTLGGIVMNGYNIVGDGTPQALIPILTGKTELELPRTLQRLLERRYCDEFPMVWKDFQGKGYATAYGEDSSGIGTFTVRMNGFNNQPTDHYFRPFYMVAERGFYRMFPKSCLGSKRRSEVFFDWVRQFFTTYKNRPKFMFGFHSNLSHGDINLVETADLDLQRTLMNLNKVGHLNNTLLILMSDHGARFSEVRATLQGKQEERRPFFGFAFPKWFENKYPKIIQNMKINTNRLSTPFDIYFTLRDVLDYDDSIVNSISKRGMSLFKEIPKTRSCENAGIHDHWCACLEWRTLTTDDSNVLQAAESFLKHLNDLTSPHRKLCSELKLSRIVKAFTLLPKENMLKFKKSLDEDGAIPMFYKSTEVIGVKYQIWVQTTPGNGSFEATINYNTQNNVFIAHTDHISRVNKYGSDAKCIENITADLRKFCYCIT